MPRAVAKILRRLLEPHARPLRARDFLRLLDAAKLPQRHTPRVFRRHPCRDVLPRALLKVHVLNITGPAIVGAAPLLRIGQSVRGRAGAFTIAIVATALATPFVRAAPLGWLPDPIEAYLRPVPALTHFAFFP